MGKKGISVKGVTAEGIHLPAIRWRWVAFFVLAALLIVAAGLAYYQNELRRIRQEKYHELAAIAELKAGQIVQWRQLLLDDARRLANSPLVREAVAEWLQGSQSSSLQADLEERLKPDQEMGIYAAMLLVDPRGQAPIPLLAEPAPLEPEERRALEETLARGEAVLSDFYRCSLGHIHLDAIAPVLDAGGRPLAAMVLRANAADVFYPLICSWPVPSQSAETLLVRVEGEEVLFLNDLRFRPGAALSFRLPLSRTELPSVQAALGKQGMFEGRDYRGVKVLADLRPIPGSPWFMVAKVDLAEILAEARYRAGVVAFFTVVFILLAALTAIYGYRQRQARLYRELYQAERREQEAQKWFRTTLYSIGDAVLTTDAAGAVKQMNPEAERLTGWTEAEARGRPIEEVFRLLNEETRAAAENPVQRVLREGVVVGLANHSLLLAKDGAERPIADSGAPIRDEAGAIIGVVLAFRDQTEERAAQRALTESNARLQALLRAAPVGIGLVSPPPERRLLEVNERLCEMLGYSREELIGQSARVLYPSDEDFDFVGRVKYAQIRERGVGSVETRWQRKDGSIINVLLSSALVDPADPSAGTTFTALDITERKRVEEALRASEGRYRLLVETANEGIWTMDADHVTTYVNQAMADMLGYTPEEMLGHKVEEFFFPEDMPFHEERMRKRHAGEDEIYERRFRRRDGSPLWTLVSARALKDAQGRFAGSFGMFTDITERKQMEEERQKLEAQLRQAQKMEAVGRLAGGVAHDFNNMLGVILGYASMALARLEPHDPLYQDLQEIIGAAKRSAELTQRLLAFSRRQTIAPRVLDLNEQLKGMERMLRRIVGEDITLEFRLSAELWPVRLDPSQIDQVLANLVVNSRDAMPEGGMLVVETSNATLDQAYLRAHPWARPGDYVLLTVSDTGCGMDRETLEHVFEPFFTTKGPGKGTGLGLSTVYGIVKQNEGFIDIYSEPGRGTTVKIYFPRYRGEEKPQPLEARKAAPAGGQETILVVEDEDALRQLARRLLERLGYQVLEAANPNEALEVCARHDGGIHLLLTDVVMPQMSGKELAERIRATKPGLKTLFMSGYAAETIAQRGVLEEGIHFLPKPFSPDDLAKKVREALGS